MKLTRTSIISGQTHTLDLPVTMEQVLRYQRGALIQEAFPNLSPELREFVMTGITPDEWTEHMRPPPDDEEDEL